VFLNFRCMFARKLSRKFRTGSPPACAYCTQTGLHHSETAPDLFPLQP
jgi:hypothetical protein